MKAFGKLGFGVRGVALKDLGLGFLSEQGVVFNAR